MLIIWDRLFGTFCAETYRPTYGLTHNVDSYNPFKLQYYMYADIWRDLRRARTWRQKFGYVFGPPGWAPTEAEPTSATNLETATA
jgi:hypothetical protein